MKKLDKSPPKSISPIKKKSTVSKMQTNAKHAESFTTISQKLQGMQQSLLPDGWSILQNSSNIITLCYICQYNSHHQIVFTVTVYSNFTYSIRAFTHFNVNIPHMLITDTTHLINLLNYLSSLKVCPGNSDPPFLQLADSRKTNKFIDRHGKIIK